jgi:hypothetical protein
MAKSDTPERGPGGRFPKGKGKGWGGPANGSGWGGPENGEHPNPAPRAAASALTIPVRGDGRAEKAAATIASKAEVLEFYTDVFRNKNESTLYRIAAADKLLDRTEGKPGPPREPETDRNVVIVGGLPE